MRQLQAAGPGIKGGGNEACIPQGIERRAGLRAHAYPAVHELGFLRVAQRGMGQETLLGDAARAGQHLLEQGVVVLAVARAGAELVGAQNLEDLEVDVAARDEHVYSTIGPPARRRIAYPSDCPCGMPLSSFLHGTELRLRPAGVPRDQGAAGRYAGKE